MSKVAARLRSPLLFLVLLILPLHFLLKRQFHGSTVDPFWLLLNNVLLLLYLSNMFIRGLWSGITRKPFGPAAHSLKRRIDTELACNEVRTLLSNRGFLFSNDSNYAEQRTIGHWGMVLAHLSLIVLIIFGSYDYTTQFSGTVTSGSGVPLPLYREGSYSALAEGYFQKVSGVQIKLQVRKQLLPSPEWPAGAADIALLSPKGEVLKEGIISPGRPFSYEGYEVRMEHLFHTIWFAITTTAQHDLFGGIVEGIPRPDTTQPVYEGEFWDDLTGIKGKIRFDANQEKVLIEAEHKGRKIGEVQLGMGSERIRELNGYRFKFESYGRMTTFSVTKLRHKKVRYAGLFFAVCGTLLWATFRPCRVWIQSQQTGCFIESNRRLVMKGLLQ